MHKRINCSKKNIKIWFLNKEKILTNEIDALAYKIENGLLKLIESLENKNYEGDWNDSLMIRESNSSYSV